VVLDPNFASNRLIYLAYSKAAPDTPAGASPMQTDATLAVMRAKWDGGYRLTDVKDIYVANEWYGKPPLAEKCCGQGPASGSFGGRLAIGADGKLYVSSGDRNFGERAQDPASAFGKILRLELDGSPARDNPFAGRAGWLPEIWSIGHRNPTGMAFDPATGRLWETEFGPRGGDEINIIQRGGNYGWMDVTQGYHYNGEPAKGVREVEGRIDPIWAFGPPSANPGNIAVYRGSAFPAWEGNLLIAMMNRSLVRMKLSSDGHVVGQEVLLQNLSQRLRDVRVAPDGAVYILTDETDGALLKITPRS
jgi:glucose/arabinose dehydrogenase